MVRQIHQPPTTGKLLDDIERLIPDGQERQTWLDTPNDMFGGATPRAVMESGMEGQQQMSDLLEAIKLGLTT